MKRESLILSLLLLLFIGCSKGARYRPLEWKVGQWVAYEFNDEPIKISIVGKDSNLFWIETAEPEIIVKVLVEEGKISEPRKLIVKKLADTAVEFALDKFSMKAQLPAIEIHKSSSLEREILTLPCGRFKTFHITEQGREVWLANNVPVLGIVKYENGNETLLLRAYGTRGAHSEIKEEAKLTEI